MKTQKQMELAARRRVLAQYVHFNEIQTGPNPLTNEEIKLLIKRRPEIWGKFRTWVQDV